MYLIASKPDIMFAVCLCPRYQSNPKNLTFKLSKESLDTLKGKLLLVSGILKRETLNFMLKLTMTIEGAILTGKSTSIGCLFLGPRLVSWQCKKKWNEFVSTVEAEYIVASACWSQVLRCHSQRLNYEFNCLWLIILVQVCSENQLANLLTKAFEARRFEYFVKAIGMCWNIRSSKLCIYILVDVRATSQIVKDKGDMRIRLDTWRCAETITRTP